MLEKLKKLGLYFIAFLIPVTLTSQIIHNIETKNLSAILAVKHQMFSIDFDTTITEERVEYYDGNGTIVFVFEYDYYFERSKHWLKQYDAPFKSYSGYTDRKRDSYISEKQLNDSTHILEHLAHDSLYVSTYTFLDSQTILILPDSTRLERKFDSQHNFTEEKYIKKNGEIDIFYQYEVLAVDEKGNWTARLERRTSDRQTNTTLHHREIKYADEYEIVSYFELNIDTAALDDRLITDPEILKPYRDLSNEEDHDEAFFDKKRTYEVFRSLFYQKYFNNDYFFRFSTDEKGAAETLEDRLLWYYSTFVIDLKEQKYFSGRTQSDRWFDKTSSFNSLESLQSPPVPTERWTQINGYNCREYIASNSIGTVDRFFVTEQLPFVNYFEFTFTLPGFVMKSERYIPELGTIKLVMDMQECEYPFHFLEFVNELNEKYGTEIGYLQEKKNDNH